VLSGGVDREVRAGDRGQRRRKPVHVVEQVEGVRDPDEPDDPDGPGKDVVLHDLHLEAAGESDDCSGDLDSELGQGAQVAEIVQETHGEEERRSDQDAAELAAPLDRADGERHADPGREPGEDADAAEGRRGLGVPPRAARDGDEAPADRRTQEDPENREGDRKRGDRDDRIHSLERVVERPVALDSFSITVYADVIRYRELFGSLFRRDLRAKYRGSVLGLAWSLLHPLVLMAVYLLVFSLLWRVAEVGSGDYWLFLLCGLPAWVFFATAAQASSRSLLENANLIRKVRFPRQLVPLSIVATHLVGFAVMMVVVVVLSLIKLPEARDTVWLAFPLGALFACMVAGVALAIASLNALFRDVEHLLTALLLPWFFLTPILYSLDQLPGVADYPAAEFAIHWVNFLTPPIEAMRDVLFYGELPELSETLYTVAVAAVALAGGAFVFSRSDDRIAVEV
jgi:ABC-type polysaccharide/polyol phosphate export permease